MQSQTSAKITCQFCGHTDTIDSEDFQLDNHGKGFWCEVCDGYTYFDSIAIRHRFTLIFEDKGANETVVPSLPLPFKLNKRLSPYRYPGGKTKIVNYLYTHLQQAKTRKLISLFTGGGSFELAMLEAGLVEEVHLNDLDTGVFSLWWVMKHMPYELIERINSGEPNHKDYFSAQAVIKSDYVGVEPYCVLKGVNEVDNCNCCDEVKKELATCEECGEDVCIECLTVTPYHLIDFNLCKRCYENLYE